MGERPPPLVDNGKTYDTEFVIPIDSVCMRFGTGHDWFDNGDHKHCLLCGAEWWSPPPEDNNK